MIMGKYQHLTDFQIEQGIQKGDFREEGMLIRNVSNGETIKIKSMRNNETASIPQTFIQINNTTVYQADLKPLFDLIRESKNSITFGELEEKYGVLLDFFDSYITYDSHLSDLLKETISVSPIFENRIRRYIDDLDFDKIESTHIDAFIGSMSAYINVIFIYIISSFATYGNRFKNDKVIIGKITNFRNMIRKVYEQLLASSSYDNRENKHRINMRNSVYALYLFDKNYDVLRLDALVQHDTRFSSGLDVVRFFKDFHREQVYESQNRDTFKIQTTIPYIGHNSKRIMLIEKINSILNDLDNLENLRTEICGIDDDDELLALAISGIRS